MSIEKTHERKVLTFSFGPHVKGKYVTVLASAPAEDYEEKKTVPNVGHSSLSFPYDFDGTCEVKVIGSAGGEDEGQLFV